MPYRFVEGMNMKLKVGDRVLCRLSVPIDSDEPKVREGRLIRYCEIMFKGWMVLIKDWDMEGKFSEEHLLPIPEITSPAQLQAMKVLFR
jgi:hypothetical protein